MLHHEPKSSSFTFCSKAWWYKEKLEKIKCKRRVQKRQEAVLEFFRETEPRGYTHTHTHTHTRVYIWRERGREGGGERLIDILQELAHKVMEAEKSHILTSCPLQAGKPGKLVMLLSPSLKARESRLCKSQSESESLGTRRALARAQEL